MEHDTTSCLVRCSFAALVGALASGGLLVISCHRYRQPQPQIDSWVAAGSSQLKKIGPADLARKPEGRVRRAEADFGSLGEVATPKSLAPVSCTRVCPYIMISPGLNSRQLCREG